MISGNRQQLLIILLLVILTFHMGRVVLQGEDDPVFLYDSSNIIQVELGSGFSEQMIHQFIDGTRPLGVIKMTGLSVASDIHDSVKLHAELKTGEKIDLIVQGREVKGFKISWMSAAKRIALGIPLHPDRMNETDWKVLPGIGDGMARKIEQDRQYNGEFGSFSALQRVSGLGKKRLRSWNQYFFTESPNM